MVLSLSDGFRIDATHACLAFPTFPQLSTGTIVRISLETSGSVLLDPIKVQPRGQSCYFVHQTDREARA